MPRRRKQSEPMTLDCKAPYDPLTIFSKDYEIPAVLPGYSVRKRDRPADFDPATSKRQKRMSPPMPRFKEGHLYRKKMKERRVKGDPKLGDLDAATILAEMSQTAKSQSQVQLWDWQPNVGQSVIKKEPCDPMIKLEPKSSGSDMSIEKENFIPPEQQSSIKIKKEQLSELLIIGSDDV